MLFNSFEFVLIFMPLTLFLFWGVPTTELKRWVLLGASLLFYSYWFWPYLILLLFLVYVAWAGALYVDRHAKLSSWAVVIILFGSLFFFKYLNFFLGLLADFNVPLRKFDLAYFSLPLGISFIVFQAFGYFVDVRKKAYPPEKKFFDLLLFKAFFPQLIAGPICRAKQLLPQLKGPFVFNQVRFSSGLAIFSLGLLLKVFFAESLAPNVDKLFDLPSFSALDAFVAAIGFGMQIFADFWGYSTMAVGLARMFDIDLPINFNLPYISVSLREFWRRWHITLSQWLRDYLYKALGGSRNGVCVTVYALMITMLLGGLWHGANYTFIFWGAIHGAILVFEHFFPKLNIRSGSFVQPFINMLTWFYAFIVINITWLFFRASDLQQAFHGSNMFIHFIIDFKMYELNIIHKTILFLVLLLWVAQFAIEYFIRSGLKGKFQSITNYHVSFWVCLTAVILGSPSPVPFIYFQF